MTYKFQSVALPLQAREQMYLHLPHRLAHDTLDMQRNVVRYEITRTLLPTACDMLRKRRA